MRIPQNLLRVYNMLMKTPSSSWHLLYNFSIEKISRMVWNNFMMHLCIVATLCFFKITSPRNYYYCDQDDFPWVCGSKYASKSNCCHRHLVLYISDVKKFPYLPKIYISATSETALTLCFWTAGLIQNNGCGTDSIGASGSHDGRGCFHCLFEIFSISLARWNSWSYLWNNDFSEDFTCGVQGQRASWRTYSKVKIVDNDILLTQLTLILVISEKDFIWYDQVL